MKKHSDHRVIVRYKTCNEIAPGDAGAISFNYYDLARRSSNLLIKSLKSLSKDCSSTLGCKEKASFLDTKLKVGLC